MYTLIDTQEDLLELISRINDNPSTLFADLESTGLNFHKDKVLLLQIGHQGSPYVIDIRKLGNELFRQFISRTAHLKYVWHNAKFDLKFVLAKTGILLEDVFDTMTCEVVLNAGMGQQYYSLMFLVEKYTDFFMDKEVQTSFIDMPDDQPFTEAQLTYSAFDVIVLPEIYEKQLEATKEANEENIIELEMELIPVVAQMEVTGIHIDTVRWLELEKTATEERKKVEARFIGEIANQIFLNKEYEDGFELATAVCIPVKTKKLTKALQDITDVPLIRGWFSENFNVNSHKQVLTTLNLLGIKIPNTNVKTLLDYVSKYPILNSLLELRELGKKISSYGTKFLQNINPVTGKIHTEYHTTGTQTGRFTSNKPNMQQIPRSGGYRECFIPSPGYVFVSLDYSQQEYRLAGALSREPAIIEAYKNGYDMHSATGAIVSGKNIDEIDSDERNLGKTLNFAILYGSTEYGLQHNLKISIDRAREIIDTFWAGYPYLQMFNDLIGKKILELGYSATPMGRRRYNIAKPQYMDSNGYVKWRERVLREGRNLVIQGGGADILKIAMINVAKRNPFGDKLRMLLQIHDELLVEVHESIKEEGFEFVKKEMEKAEQPFLGEIPAVVEGEIKERWSK